MTAYLFWLGLVWFDLVWFGLVWFGCMTIYPLAAWALWHASVTQSQFIQLSESVGAQPLLGEQPSFNFTPLIFSTYWYSPLFLLFYNPPIIYISNICSTFICCITSFTSSTPLTTPPYIKYFSWLQWYWPWPWIYFCGCGLPVILLSDHCTWYG